MKKELLKINNKEVAIQIVNSEIKAIRNKDITTVGARVYDKGLIGVAGQYGDKNIEALYKKAEDNLKLNIKYPCEITKDVQVEFKSKPINQNNGQIIKEIEELFKELNSPLNDLGFLARGDIKILNEDRSLTNDEGLNCHMSKENIEIEIALKEKGSPDICDTAYIFEGKNFNKDEVKDGIINMCKVQKNKVELPVNKGEKIRCVFPQNEGIQRFFEKELNGEKIGRDASFFSNKFGKKLFNDKVTLYCSNLFEEHGVPFDMEGILNKGEKNPFITNGVLNNGYTDKKTAYKYNLKATGNAFGKFNEVPSLEADNLALKKEDKTLVELIDGKPAIFIIMAQGGDFTSDGTFGTPVQWAYLFDGEKFIGKIPEISIRSNIYDMFGKDFVGVPKEGFKGFGIDMLAVMDMEIS